MKRAVVVGLGNPYRGDDAAGLAVVARLHGRVPAGVELVECEREATRLLDTWAGRDAAILVDAVASGAAVGTVHRFDASAQPLPARVFRGSTHAFGLADAVELGRALQTLPTTVIVHGVEGRAFAAGEELSSAVASAVERVAQAVLDDLERLGEQEERCTNEH